MRSFLLVPLLLICLVITGSSHDRFGSPRGQLSVEFAKAVALSPEKLFKEFVADDRVPEVKFGEGFKKVSRMVRRSLKRMAASPFDDCLPKFKGDNTDSDKDGIPANGLFYVKCEAGNENLYGEVKVVDENDEVDFPESGAKFRVNSAKGKLLNEKKEAVGFTMEPSLFKVAKKKKKVYSEGSALATFYIASKGTEMTMGFQGEAEFTGKDLENPAVGDSAILAGVVKYQGLKVSGLPDVNFVANVEGEITFGKCADSDEVTVVSGEGVLTDTKDNVARFKVADCKGSLTYNDVAIKIDDKDSLRMPE